MIIHGENFFDQLADSDIKQYEKIRKLSTSQSELQGVCWIMITSKIIAD